MGLLLAVRSQEYPAQGAALALCTVQYSAVQGDSLEISTVQSGGTTSALLDMCHHCTILSLAKQRVNCPHTCMQNKQHERYEENTFYLLIIYQLLTINIRYSAVLFCRHHFPKEKIKECLKICTVPCSIKRYQDTISTISQFLMVKSENWATVSVLQYFLAPIRHRRW